MTAVDPDASDPDCARTGAVDPMARGPDPAAAPNPFATDPDVVGTGRGDDDFGLRCRWWDVDHGWFGRIDRAVGGVDHEIDDVLTHAGLVEVDNVGGAQMVNRVGRLDLADDDVVRDAGSDHCFDVLRVKRAGLFDAFVGLGSLSTQAGAFVLVDGVADDGTSRCAKCATDQGAFARMAATEDRAEGGSPAGADERACSGVVDGAVWIFAAGNKGGRSKERQNEVLHILTGDINVVVALDRQLVETFNSRNEFTLRFF